MKHKFTLRLKKAGKTVFSLLTMVLSLAALESHGQMKWEFTNAAATGRSGPTQTQVNSAYAGTLLESEVTVSPQGIQKWTVPFSGLYLIEAEGAQGGNSGAVSGGLGAAVSGEFYLNAGDVLSIVVGQQGLGNTSSGATGGGGGSFVTLGSDHLSSLPLVVAGGGSGTGGNSAGNDAQIGTLSGAGDSCLEGTDDGAGGNSAQTCSWGAGGAGGFLTDGEGETGWSVQHGYAFRNGAMGGTSSAGNRAGGFGGGAGTHGNNTGGGAGGGYSGGSAPRHGAAYNGGGGSSFNAGDHPVFTAGVGTGHGSVSVTYLYFITQVELNHASCPETSDGSIVATVEGGTPPYTFEWSNGVVTPTDLAPGDYTLTVTDADGAVTSKTFTVGPDVLEVSIEMTQASSCNEISDGAAEAHVAGGTAPYTFSWDSGEDAAAISNKGIGFYTVTVTDDNGCNPGIETVEITPDDTTPPTVEVRNIDVWLDADGFAVIEAEEVDNGSTDDCNLAEIALDKTEFSCDDFGQNTVTLTAVDAAGNSSQAQAIVTVADTISPVATVQNLTLELDANGTALINVGQIDNGSSDNCGIDEMVLSKTAFDCTDIGANDVVLTVADLSGNQKTATAQVQVVDNIAPSLTVQNIEVALNADGSASITTDDVEVSSGDNCGVVSKSLNIHTFSCADLGEVTVEMTVADASGNERTEAVTVTVTDNIAPVANPQAYTVALDADGLAEFTSADVKQFIGGDDTDNCIGIADGSHSLSLMQFSCEDLGENVLTYAVQDLSGNEGTAPVVITVVDNVAPQALAQNITVELDEDGMAVIDPMDADNGSVDNCSIASRTLSISEFSCADLGEQAVTLTVTDGSGNQSQAVFTVNVIDQTAPVIAPSVSAVVYLDENGQGTLNSAPVLAQATDNCGLDAIVVQDGEGYEDINGFSFSCEEVGAVQGPVFVRDNSGNLTEFTLELSVLDTIKPSLELEVIHLQSDADGNAFLTQEMLLPYAVDNCGIAEVAIQTTDFDCSTVGETQFTEIIVFDLNGNFRQQTLTVVIDDEIAPEVQVENIVIELNADGQAILNPEMLDMIITENCTVSQKIISQTEFSCADLGESINTFTVADLAGNTGEAVFTVTVTDHIAPTISGPQVLTACEGIPVSYDDITASDNCSATLTVVFGPQEGDVLTPGEYLVEFEAVDPSGNTTSHIAVLDVKVPAQVDLGDDMAVPAGTEVTLTAGAENGNTYLWDNGETGAVYQFTATEDVIVSVVVVTPYGCVSTDQIEVTIDDALSVAEDSEDSTVRFFPNPTRDQLSVEFSLKGNSRDVLLSVFDLSGKKLAEKMIPAAQSSDIHRLDLSGLASGIYLINLMSDDINLTRQVVKQ